MGKSSKKKLEARLTEADAGLRDLESTRAALTEELRSERERHAEETTALRREHEQLVEIKRSTQEELARVGEELTATRVALEKATEEQSRLAADLRDRDEHSRTLLQDLDDAVEAALGQLSGALMRMRDAAPAAASVSTEDESIPEAAPVSTHTKARASDDATPVDEEAPEPDAPIEVAEPADPPGEDDDAGSYEVDWYRFLKHTQAHDDEGAPPPA
ncbi:MAG TPA: hypothetical protein VFI59_04250 [Actinomycetota bacterium]|nr:hypothetical protein [Actinomycetota bacterium]